MCSKTSPVHAHALATRARLLLASEKAAEALSSTVQAVTLMEKFGSVDEGEALIRLVYAESLHATGQSAAARIAITIIRCCSRAAADWDSSTDSTSTMVRKNPPVGHGWVAVSLGKKRLFTKTFPCPTCLSRC